MARTLLAATFLAAGLLAAGAASAATLAEQTMLHARLNAASEVPANASTGSGEAVMTYDPGTHTLQYKITYSGLSGPATAAHIHGPAEAGRNAGFVVPFKAPVTSPIEGSVTLTDGQGEQLMGGLMYVNVHTAAHPGGEIRGQILK